MNLPELCEGKIRTVVRFPNLSMPWAEVPRGANEKFAQSEEMYAIL